MSGSEIRFKWNSTRQTSTNTLKDRIHLLAGWRKRRERNGASVDEPEIELGFTGDSPLATLALCASGNLHIEKGDESAGFFRVFLRTKSNPAGLIRLSRAQNGRAVSNSAWPSRIGLFEIAKGFFGTKSDRPGRTGVRFFPAYVICVI